MKKNFFKKNSQAGFTLIELMVATSIFMIIMLVAMGSLVVTSDSAKKSNALNFTMDNLNFAMESMTRSIRMGTNYYCSDSFSVQLNLGESDCLSGAIGMAFKPAGENLGSGSRMAYRLAVRGDNTYTIQRCDTSINGCVDIIATNINIDPNAFKFFVRGSTVNNIDQPSVYMIIKGTVTIKNEALSFAIQTMVSQRTAE